MAVLSIAAAEVDAVEVDLWGTEFATVAITRTRARAIRDLQTEYADLDEDRDDVNDEIVRLFSLMLDQMLAPAPGKRKKPSEVIEAKWKADELTLSRLISFVEELADAVQRPT